MDTDGTRMKTDKTRQKKASLARLSVFLSVLIRPNPYYYLPVSSRLARILGEPKPRGAPGKQSSK